MTRWFHPAFEADLIDAAQYLEKQRPGLGTEFLDAVESAIDLIMRSPVRWRPWAGEIRRYVLPHFRYTVRYRVRPDEGLVEFLSVIHTSRHPATGLDR